MNYRDIITIASRIGGVPIAATLAVNVLALQELDWPRAEPANGLAMLALAAIPAFAGGFAEDVTKRFGVLARLLLTINAGVIAALLGGATLDRLDTRSSKPCSRSTGGSSCMAATPDCRMRCISIT